MDLNLKSSETYIKIQELGLEPVSAMYKAASLPMMKCYSLTFTHIGSAARFGDLLPFGLLFQPFGDQYFDLATWEFGDFLGYFLK